MENKKFYFITPLGFEKVSYNELSFWFDGASNPIFSKGGYEVELPFDIGCRLNTFMKTPTRILLRVGRYEGTYGKDFLNWLKNLNLDKFKLNSPQIHLSSGLGGDKSQKFISKEIEKVLSKYDLNGSDSGTLFFRATDGTVDVSLDTSGESLYKRGKKKSSVKAPIRENLVSSFFWKIFSEFGLENFSDYHLIDPFVGSGTVLIEGEGLFAPVKTRTFAFERYLSSDISIETKKSFLGYLGFDNDNSAIEASLENTRVIEPKARIMRHDSFRRLPFDWNKKCWVITNPPHGIRLSKGINLSKHYSNIINSIKINFQPEILGIVVISKVSLDDIRWPENYKVKLVQPFDLGGLEAQFIVFEKIKSGLL